MNKQKHLEHAADESKIKQESLWPHTVLNIDINCHLVAGLTLLEEKWQQVKSV